MAEERPRWGLEAIHLEDLSAVERPQEEVAVYEWVERGALGLAAKQIRQQAIKDEGVTITKTESIDSWVIIKEEPAHKWADEEPWIGL